MELKKTARIDLLKERMLYQPRYVSMEQAMIITRAYQRHRATGADCRKPDKGGTLWGGISRKRYFLGGSGAGDAADTSAG